MSLLFEDFILRALIAGIGVALVAGPMGCFIVWRRMAYFGDTMAHGALLGIALALMAEVNILAGVAAIGVLLAGFLSILMRQGRFGSDTLLGIFSHSTLAIGLVVLGLMEGIRVDLLGYLFGDILAVTAGNIAWIYGGGAVVLVILAAIWRPLLSVTVNPELARAEGVKPERVEFVYMLLIALVIAGAMKIVGVLLVTSLLVIPAAAARGFSRTPEGMAVTASLIGMAAVTLGIATSVSVDVPTGPAIVVAAFALFVTALGLARVRRLP